MYEKTDEPGTRASLSAKGSLRFRSRVLQHLAPVEKLDGGNELAHVMQIQRAASSNNTTRFRVIFPAVFPVFPFPGRAAVGPGTRGPGSRCQTFPREAVQGERGNGFYAYAKVFPQKKSLRETYDLFRNAHHTPGRGETFRRDVNTLTASAGSFHPAQIILDPSGDKESADDTS